MKDHIDNSDLPVGFRMHLAAEPEAMHTFHALSEQQKNEVIQYMQAAVDGDDSEFRVINAVEKLKSNQIGEITSAIQQDRYF